MSGQNFLPAGASNVGGRRGGISSLGRVDQSIRRWKGGASTLGNCISYASRLKVKCTNLALCEDSSYAVEEIEGRDDVALDHDAAHDC